MTEGSVVPDSRMVEFFDERNLDHSYGAPLTYVSYESARDVWLESPP